MVHSNKQDPYSIIKRIMREEMEMNWASNVPHDEHPGSPVSVEIIQNKPENPDIQYISQLTTELKDKLDTLYQLVANTEEAYSLQTREIIRCLLDVNNLIDGPIDQLNLINNLQNKAGQTTTVIL